MWMPSTQRTCRKSWRSSPACAGARWTCTRCCTACLRAHGGQDGLAPQRPCPDPPTVPSATCLQPRAGRQRLGHRWGGCIGGAHRPPQHSAGAEPQRLQLCRLPRPGTHLPEACPIHAVRCVGPAVLRRHQTPTVRCAGPPPAPPSSCPCTGLLPFAGVAADGPADSVPARFDHWRWAGRGAPAARRMAGAFAALRPGISVHQRKRAGGAAPCGGGDAGAAGGAGLR